MSGAQQRARAMTPLEDAEIAVERARSKGKWTQASEELEAWVSAGRQMLSDAGAAQPTARSSSAPQASSSAAPSSTPTPRVPRGISSVGSLLAPRLGRGRSSEASTRLEESLTELQLKERLAACEKTLKKNGHGNERVEYVCVVNKHNEHGKVQLRALVVTSVAVYNCEVGCTKLKRRIPLKSLGSITLHEPEGQLALHVPSEYDYLLAVSQPGYDVAAGTGGADARTSAAGAGPLTPRLSACGALVGALQRAYQAQHKSSGETLVVRTFSGAGSLKDHLQRKEKRRTSGRDSASLSFGSLEDFDEDDDHADGDENEYSEASSGKTYESSRAPPTPKGPVDLD